MGDPRQRHELLLREIIEATPPPKSPGGPNDTVSFLIGIAGAWPGPISRDQRAGLEAVCRKLAVTRKVLLSYDIEWKRATDTRLLSAQYWGILIAILLAQFNEQEGTAEYALGMELRRLNAAYIAIDIAGSLENVPYLTELESWADERLTELTGT